MSGGWNPEKVKIFKAAFYEFLDHVTINSKETGGNTQLAECLYESQKFFYEEIFSGLENDIHDFKIGKARQLGISVACRPLMLFWIGWHPGMQGAMVYDTGEHKDEARGEIEWVIDNLPKHIRFPKKISCNRNMLKLDNGSNIRFMSAGVKKSRAAGTLGRSSGINLVHASEMCSWENQEGISAFTNSLAENFPDRLYIWESTARGFNEWFNMWSEAQNDTTHQKAIFIGWWRKEIYSIPRDHRDFEKYGLDAPTETETKRIKTVKEKYGYDIAPEQLAWWRKKIDPSGMREDGEPEDSFKIEDFPWDEEEMFLATGSKFFDVEKLTENIRKAATTKYQSYRFWPGSDFLTCSIAKAQTWRDVNLKIWEDADPSSVYVIAADPAFGHDPNNDRSACQVLKCYADGIEQVAEFADATVTTDQFAWLILALAGRYSGCTEGWNNPVHMILEINGPGEAVWNAIKAVKAVVNDGYLKMQAKDMGLGNIFQNVRNYIYSRSDSMTTGHNFHFKTNLQLKIAILERLRDMNNSALVTIQSRETLEEMRTLTRNGDSISAEGRAKDDRVISLALGIHQWESAVRRNMIAHRRTKSAEVARKAADPRSRFQLFNQFQMNVRLKHKTAVRAQAKIALAKERWRNQKSWTRHTWGRM